MVASGLIMFGVMRFAPNLIELGEWVPYAVATTLLVFSVVAAWFIKEPPIFNPAHAPFKPWSALQIGLRDRRIIWLMAGAAMLASFEFVFAGWTWIFAKTNLGLERGQIYHALSWAQLVSLALAFPTGWLIDKVGGLKVVVIYYLFMLVNLVLLLRVHDAPSLALYVAIMTAVNPLNSAADIMIFKTADPKEVGSVTSSSAFIRNFYNGSLLFMSGWFIHLTNRNYHMLFIIAAVLMSVGLALIFVYAKKMSPRTESAPSEKSESECGS
jgi:Na+/melibiose symporter-like transporter